MTGSILNDSFCPLPFACWASPPPSRQAFNSLLPPISLSPPSSPFWAHPEKSKSPCPVETAYSRQGPKVPVESQPDARHKHSPERAQPGSPATWSGAQRLPATPGCVSRASRGPLCLQRSLFPFPPLPPGHTGRSARLWGRPVRPRRGEGTPPPRPSVSPPCRAKRPFRAGHARQRLATSRGVSRVGARACHSRREFGLRPGTLNFSERSCP